MMTVDLPDFVLIDGYPIDCFLREEHHLETEVTALPVESGSSIADNLWIKPAVVTVEGIVSSIPLAAIASQRDDPASAPSEAYKRHLAIRQQKRLVTIVTSLDLWTNMAMTSLDINRDPGSASYLHFTARFEQVQTVSVDKAVAAIPTANAVKKKTANLKSASGQGTFPVVSFRSIVTGEAVPPSLSHPLWFDNNIGGWRQSVARDPSPAGTYLLKRGQPYGFTPDQWETLGDFGVKQTLDAARVSGDSAIEDYSPIHNAPSSVRTNINRGTGRIVG